jgi:hypothetical protein
LNNGTITPSQAQNYLSTIDYTNSSTVGNDIQKQQRPSKIALALQNVSIPSEQLLDLCSKDGVVNGTDLDAWSKCHIVMADMALNYCQHNPPTQYTDTLCRDQRYFKFFGITKHTEKLPSNASEILKEKQATVIGPLEFKLITGSILNTGGYISAWVNVTNHSNQDIALNSTNFAFIDEMGNVFKSDSAYILKPYPKGPEDFNPMDHISANAKVTIVAEGSISYTKGNLLRIQFDNQTRYYWMGA